MKIKFVAHFKGLAHGANDAHGLGLQRERWEKGINLIALNNSKAPPLRKPPPLPGQVSRFPRSARLLRIRPMEPTSGSLVAQPQEIASFVRLLHKLSQSARATDPLSRGELRRLCLAWRSSVRMSGSIWSPAMMGSRKDSFLRGLSVLGRSSMMLLLPLFPWLPPLLRLELLC